MRDQKHYSYITYGLRIESGIPLPELTPAPVTRPDVIIRRGKTGRPQPVTDDDGSYFELAADESFLFWKQVGGFLVRGGSEIIVDSFPWVNEGVIRLPLLGTVLTAAVEQRGAISLHASAVNIGGQAVAFLGPRGAGKSTIAATLYGRGHALLADDAVAVDMNGSETARVLPGFSQLKLFPDAAAASLGDNPEVLPRLISGFEKRARRAPDGFSPEPVPLKCLYVLDTAPVVEIQPLPPQERIVQVISQSYAARIFKKSLTGDKASTHLLQCAKLASRVPIFRLSRPRSLADLSEVARLVEERVEQPLYQAAS